MIMTEVRASATAPSDPEAGPRLLRALATDASAEIEL
jgi:hypothetical protein